MTTNTVKRGFTFTHTRFIDPDWEPAAGETYVKDGPKAPMIVTRVTTYAVYYKHLAAGSTDRAAGSRQRPWVMDRRAFEKLYGGA